jgi:hypothetical protein
LSDYGSWMRSISLSAAGDKATDGQPGSINVGSERTIAAVVGAFVSIAQRGNAGN